MPQSPANILLDNIYITPNRIKPGDSVTIQFNITSDTSLSSFKIALYCRFEGVNYLATPIISGTSVTANTPKAVTLTTTAPSRSATVDNRITAFAAGENNDVHNVPLYIGFREISPLVIGSGFVSAGTGEFWEESSTAAGAFGASANPSIEKILIERASYNTETNLFYLDDEGERAFVTCKLALGDESAASGFECWLTWGNNSARVCAGIAMSIYNRGTGMWSYGYEWLFQGLERDYCILYNHSFGADDFTTFTCTYGDAYESVSETFVLHPAFANVHLSGTGKGVAFGKFSSSTVDNPLFECEYPTEFSDDVDVGGDLTVDGTASFSGNFAVGSGKLLKVVDVALSVSVASGDNTKSASRTAAQVQTAIGTGWTALCCIPAKTGSYLWYFTQTELNSGALEVSISRRSAATSAGTVNPHVRIICIRTSL